MNEFGHSRMIPKSGSNNKLKRNGGSTPFRFIAAKRRLGQPSERVRIRRRKNHDGRACARPSRSLRCYPLQGTRIKSTKWCNAGSYGHTQANLTLAIVTFGRTKRDRSGKEDSARLPSLK
jgi:hypothetical protein